VRFHLRVLAIAQRSAVGIGGDEFCIGTGLAGRRTRSQRPGCEPGDGLVAGVRLVGSGAHGEFIL
jgi:hypothetical protein